MQSTHGSNHLKRAIFLLVFIFRCFLLTEELFWAKKLPAQIGGQPMQEVYRFGHRATPHNSRLAASAPLRRLRHGICVAKILDNTQSIICAFGLAAAAPRSPYRHLEL
ncbi:MAG: hypothetical protein WBO79_05380, partial [Gemmiger qucibialis]